VTTQPDASARPVVVKIGGSTLGARDTSLRDIAEARRAGDTLVVVHGGGATISAWLERANIEAKFVRGLRATSAEALEIVVATLAGLVNKQLVAELGALGAPAIGISGADSMILQANRYDDELEFVGKIHRVNPYPIEELLRLGYLPVLAPIAVEANEGQQAQLLNTNADAAAGELAAALGARLLIFLTDVDGVLDARRNLINQLSIGEAQDAIEAGIAAGGMIPKLEAAMAAARASCDTRIINGTTPSALATALSESSIGTAIHA
jgi:acetylglutamate kinase